MQQVSFINVIKIIAVEDATITWFHGSNIKNHMFSSPSSTIRTTLITWSTFLEVPVTFRTRKVVLSFSWLHPTSKLQYFENDTIKLLTSYRSWIDWFVSHELCYHSTGFDFKFAFGPQRFRAFWEKEPCSSQLACYLHWQSKRSGFAYRQA